MEPILILAKSWESEHWGVDGKFLGWLELTQQGDVNPVPKPVDNAKVSELGDNALYNDVAVIISSLQNRQVDKVVVPPLIKWSIVFFHWGGGILLDDTKLGQLANLLGLNESDRFIPYSFGKDDDQGTIGVWMQRFAVAVCGRKTALIESLIEQLQRACQSANLYDMANLSLEQCLKQRATEMARRLKPVVMLGFLREKISELVLTSVLKCSAGQIDEDAKQSLGKLRSIIHTDTDGSPLFSVLHTYIRYHDNEQECQSLCQKWESIKQLFPESAPKTGDVIPDKDWARKLMSTVDDIIQIMLGSSDV